MMRHRSLLSVVLSVWLAIPVLQGQQQVVDLPPMTQPVTQWRSLDVPIHAGDAELRVKISNDPEPARIGVLDLGLTRVTDKGLAFLRQMPNLRVLLLKSTGITDRGVAHIATLENLLWLDLSYTTVGDEAVASLAGLKRLQRLDLDGTCVTDRSLEVLRTLPDLTGLAVRQTGISEEGMVRLAEAMQYRPVAELSIGGPTLTEEGLKRLKGNLCVTEVDLTGSTVPLRSFGLLDALPRLKRLTLEGLPVTDDVLRRVPRLGELSYLNLAGTQVTDAGVAVIGERGRTLRGLNLRHTVVTDRSVALLRQCPELTHLHLGHTRTSGTRWGPFLDLKRLEMVCLDRTPVSPEGLRILAKHPTLNLIIAIDSGVSDEVAREVAALRPGLRVVVKD